MEAILDCFAAHPDSRDLLVGTLSNAAGNSLATHQTIHKRKEDEIPKGATIRHGVVCRGHQLGAWVMDSRGLAPAGEPFEIQQSSCWRCAATLGPASIRRCLVSAATRPT